MSLKSSASYFRRELAAASSERLTYELRKEQREAVSQTRAYFDNGGEEFLWNAKPRLGKTLTSHDLVRQTGFTKVLIVTNRPSIANSWANDFFKFISWRGEYSFVSDTDALKDKPGVLSREEHLAAILHREEAMPRNMVAFESLQGLKGAIYFGGNFDKLRRMSELEFDLLIVDEAQEGVDTIRGNGVAPAAEGCGMRKSAQNRLGKQVEQDIDRTFQKIQGDYILSRLTLLRLLRAYPEIRRVRDAQRIFCRARRLDAGILGVWQVKSTPHGRKSASRLWADYFGIGSKSGMLEAMETAWKNEGGK